MTDNLAAIPTAETRLMRQSTTLPLEPSMDADRRTLRWLPRSPQPGRVVLDEEKLVVLEGPALRQRRLVTSTEDTATDKV